MALSRFGSTDNAMVSRWAAEDCRGRLNMPAEDSSLLAVSIITPALSFCMSVANNSCILIDSQSLAKLSSCLDVLLLAVIRH